MDKREGINVKQGDRVIRRDGHYTTQVVAIDKVTPTGRIKIGSTYYDKYGHEITSDSWHRGHIAIATEEELTEIEHATYTRGIIRKLNDINKLTYKQALAINEILEDKI